MVKRCIFERYFIFPCYCHCYVLTDAFQTISNIAFQEFSKEYNHELINGKHKAVAYDATNTRGLLEAAKLYAATTIDAKGLSKIPFFDKVDELLMAMLKEGVSGEQTIVGTTMNQITGTQSQIGVRSTLTLLVHPSTLM